MTSTQAGTSIRRNARLSLAFAAAIALLLGSALFSRASSAGGSDVPNVDHDLEFLVENGGETFVVRIDFLFSELATEEDKAFASEITAARFAGATRIEHEPGGVSAQFAKSGPSWANHTLSWFYNPAGKPAQLSGEANTLALAANTWNGIGAKWSFQGAGLTTLGTGGCGTSRDSQNTVGWAAQPGNTLAITCTWSTQGANQKYVEVDMEIDSQQNWTLGASGVGTDLQSVALHEFGHALGLGHAQSSKCPGAVMCATYINGSLLRMPASDDVAGILAIYGAAATPEPTATPSATATPRTLPDVPRGPFKALVAGASRN